MPSTQHNTIKVEKPFFHLLFPHKRKEEEKNGYWRKLKRVWSRESLPEKNLEMIGKRVTMIPFVGTFCRTIGGEGEIHSGEECSTYRQRKGGGGWLIWGRGDVLHSTERVCMSFGKTVFKVCLISLGDTWQLSSHH